MSFIAADVLRKAPKELLDCKVSDIHLTQIARDLRRWEGLAPWLGLSWAQEEEVRSTFRDYGDQKREALRKWRRMKSNEATYRQLVIALCSNRNVELADEIASLLSGVPQEEPSVGVWQSFQKYLIDCQREARHPSYEQWPTLSMPNYVELTLLEVASTKEQAQRESEVRLSEMFTSRHRASRQVVLIEGPPGSGKTTLTWHISQQWAEGKLFQQFSLLIPISLPSTGAGTTCLADIIPYPSKNVREKVVDAIAEKGGKGVCFLIDSWDQVPHSENWQDSYLYNFTKGQVGYSLPHCSIIVTCRPSASNVLRTCATLILQIAEFDSLKIEELVDQSMDTGSASRFLEILEEKPELCALCHLPLNITVAVHLYKTSNQELLSTRTKLYKAFVHTQLAKHWQLRTPGGHVAMEVDINNVIEFLPEKMMVKFTAMCKLAYTGVRCGNSSFDQIAIKKAGLDPIALYTLSLMQSVKGVSAATRHRFLHYTIQEYLAAYHIAKLGPEQQREAVEVLLQTSPLSTTLPFYSGLTNLRNEEVIKALLKVMDMPLDIFSIPACLVEHVNEYGSDPRRLLVALMNCIYESEVYERYGQILPLQQHLRATKQITFAHLSLTPSDCLSVGCFLRHTIIDDVMPVFWGCNIKDAAFRTLIHEILIKERVQYNPCVGLCLDSNPITHRSLKCLRQGLGSRRHTLSLSGCLESHLHPNTHVNTFKALTYLIECLSQSLDIHCFAFGENEITAEHKFHLLLLILFSRSLEFLNLMGNNLRGSMPLLAPALSHSNLIELHLYNCCLNDNDIICLGRALQHNSTLYLLDISENDVSSHAFSELLMAIQYSAISTLKYDGCVTVAHTVMLNAVNRNRHAAHRRPLYLLDGLMEKVLAYNTLNVIACLPPEFVSGQDGITK